MPSKSSRKNELELVLRWKADVNEEKEPKFREKENFDALAAECQAGSLILQEKIKLLSEKYTSFSRIISDGILFSRSFLSAYLDHIWRTQDQAELDRITAYLQQCNVTNEVYEQICTKFEELSLHFTQLLKEHSVEESKPGSLSQQEFLSRFQMLCPSASIISLSEYAGSNEWPTRQAVGIMFNPALVHNQIFKNLGYGSFRHHMELACLSDALCLPIRVVLLDESVDQSGRPILNHLDFIPWYHWTKPDSGNCTFLPPESHFGDGHVTTPQNIAASRDGATASLFFGPPLIIEDYIDTVLNEATASTSNQPVPFITLLYRRGVSSDTDHHFDILYPK